ncbi:MAG: PAS domain-containing protein [Deltaproteobacteria bacterium]|nr:PAS domain-containing protein [Deltaproteobacteria bacterium]
MQKSAPVWRLYIAFLGCAFTCALTFGLYFATWDLFYLGMGSCFLLLALLSRAAVPYFLLIEDLQYGLKHLARGEFDFRLYNAEFEEVSSVTRVFNESAAELQRRYKEILRALGEQDAVLSSMTEGVIAIDGEERILRMNGAACAFMRVAEKDAVGRAIHEVIRNAEVLRFVEAARISRDPIESDIILREDGERVLHAYGKILRDNRWNPIGVLFVFSDITRLRHLENVRRDFVANVSHELRTPITSIKGFVETLADGAIDNPADARRFLDILIRQADRLNAIFEDLLTLSRIEDGNDADMRLEPSKLVNVVKSTIESHSLRASERKMNIVTRFDADPVVRLNSNLLEQAIGNLLDNAIKYGDEGSPITVAVQSDGHESTVSVIDQGPGIEKAHHARIFERFYRVDKARTRKSGGTGLGLAIVKHIAECHHGRATVESTPGQGCTFTLHFPVVQEKTEVSVH